MFRLYHLLARRPLAGPGPSKGLGTSLPSRLTAVPWRAPAPPENNQPKERQHIMATGNTVTISGNLTRNPDLRFTAAGRATATFGVAVNNDWTDTVGERHETVDFFDIVVWGKLAENTAESLTKGQEVLIAGRLQFRSWETDEGDRRSKVEITATHIGAGLTFGTSVFTKTARNPDTTAA
jgi:single-strand DNA-binding protein